MPRRTLRRLGLLRRAKIGLYAPKSIDLVARRNLTPVLPIEIHQMRLLITAVRKLDGEVWVSTSANPNEFDTLASGQIEG